MTLSDRPALAVFDLRTESRALSRQVRTLRQVYTFLSVVFIGVLLWFIEIALTQGVVGFQWVAFPIVFLCLSSLIGLFFVLLWKTRPGAIGLAIRFEGIQFTWASGWTESLPWSVVASDLVLNDYSVSPRSRPSSANNWSMRRWNRPVSRLSKEAFDAIVRAAAGVGLAVTERNSGTGPIRWEPCRIVRFAVVPDTPHRKRVVTPD